MDDTKFLFFSDKIKSVLLKESHLFLVTAFFATLIIWYLQFHWNRRYLYKMTRNIPGPMPWPIIGSSFKFMLKCNEALILNNLMDIFAQYKGFFGVWHGPMLLCGIAQPEYFQIVMNSTKALNKSYFYTFMEAAVGKGLLTANMPIWKQHRKIINPAFNQNVINSFVGRYVEKSGILCNVLEKEIGKADVDIFQYFEKCTIDSVCSTIMGVQGNAQTTDSEVQTWMIRIFSLRHHFDFIFKWTQLYKEYDDILKKFQAFCENIIQENKRKYKKENQQLDFQTINTNNSKRKALIELLIHYNEENNPKTKLTHQELLDEVSTFMFAGAESTATTASFTFCMLGMHQDIQQKVYEEIMDVLGPDRLLQLEDLPHFKYTERVIKETLRLFPAVPFVLREITEDLQLDKKTILPKNTVVMFGLMAMHRSEEYWSDPLKFDPDRFLPEEIAKRHSCAYSPFTTGPRICIGYKQGMMLVMIMVVMLIRKYKFFTGYKSVEDIKLKMKISLHIVDSYKVSIQKRN